MLHFGNTPGNTNAKTSLNPGDKAPRRLIVDQFVYLILATKGKTRH